RHAYSSLRSSSSLRPSIISSPPLPYHPVRQPRHRPLLARRLRQPFRRHRIVVLVPVPGGIDAQHILDEVVRYAHQPADAVVYLGELLLLTSPLEGNDDCTIAHHQSPRSIRSCSRRVASYAHRRRNLCPAIRAASDGR